ncbi:MAG: hypothetical protein IJT21_07245 [Synergistaceae bacterium]|nr:hypothetical protein [Synergistaceae bacterium]
MAATIINVQAIQDSINSANRYIDEQNASLSDINNTINSMTGVWEAEDQKMYAEQFNSTQKRIETFNQGVKESLDAMKKYVDDCVAIDSQTARDLNNVSW